MSGRLRKRPAAIAGAGLLLALGLAAGGLLLHRSRSAGGDGAAPEPIAPPVPPETADAEALGRLADWHGLPRFDDGIYLQQSSAERKQRRGAKPKRMLAKGNRDLNNFICIGGQSEQVGEPEVPVVTELDSCPEPYLRGYVLARFLGSGRLARLWITSTALFQLHHRDEVLRFYVDDDRQPLIEIPLIDAVSGRAGEIFQPPFGAGSRFFLAWYYPVVFSSRLIVTLDRIKLFASYYHQTAVVLDREIRPRIRAASRLEARDRARAALQEQDFTAAAEVGGAVELGPGETVRAMDLSGPVTVRQVAVRTAWYEHLREVRLQVRWDNSSEPAIELPLAALFSSELVPPRTPGPVLSTRNTAAGFEAILRLPMPFRQRAEWTLGSNAKERISLELFAQVENRLPEGEWGRLHTQYHLTTRPTESVLHPLARVRGRGRLAGVCVTLEGHGLEPHHQHSHPLNFLEGDERGMVDGRLALPGTGTEDYFNSSFYFADGLFATAFAQGQASALRERGIAVCCRWHLLGDAVDFQSSLDLALEIGPAEPSLLDRYRSVAFLYR